MWELTACAIVQDSFAGDRRIPGAVHRSARRVGGARVGGAGGVGGLQQVPACGGTCRWGGWPLGCEVGVGKVVGRCLRRLAVEAVLVLPACRQTLHMLSVDSRWPPNFWKQA